VALGAYWHLGAGWWLFLILILVPDVAMAGYLWGPRIGAICYNALHSYIGVGLLLILGYLTGVGSCGGDCPDLGRPHRTGQSTRLRSEAHERLP
jgi:hypothetical protein